MILVSPRGTIVKASESSVALTFFWENDSPKAYSTLEGVRTELEISERDPEHWVCSVVDVGTIVLGRSPWWSEWPGVSFETGFYLSFQGFYQGYWHDGIVGQKVDGVWTDIVLPGAKFTLKLGRSTKAIDEVQEFWRDEKFFARKQSLILSMREHFRDLHSAYLVERGSLNDAEFVLFILLLRLAYPKLRLWLEPKDVAFKRLAQNLNYEIARSGVSVPNLKLAYPRSLGPKVEILELLRWQNRRSPFIPSHLFGIIQD